MAQLNEIEPLDVFGVTENRVSDESICPICYDILDETSVVNDKKIFKLPECSHSYHTKCIISWFRTGHNTCPYCMDEGTNNDNNVGWGHRRQKEQTRVTLIRKFAKKKNCPKIVTKSIEKLKKYEEQLKDVNKKLREFHADSEPKNFKEAKKELSRLRRKSWTAKSRVRQQRMKISGIPVIPLFIPKIVKIRKVGD